MSKPLTQSEVDNLPEGTPVTVTWTGGNGPHNYLIVKNRYGESCTNNIYTDRLDFVGPERPYTIVYMTIVESETP